MAFDFFIGGTIKRWAWRGKSQWCGGSGNLIRSRFWRVP